MNSIENIETLFFLLHFDSIQAKYIVVIDRNQPGVVAMNCSNIAK